MRPTEAVINLAALRRNVERLKTLATPAAVCVVTKANAYGHGAVECSRAAIEAGADWLAVALVEEGLELRSGGIDAPILVLSEPPLSAIPRALSADLTPTLYTLDGIAAAAAAASPSAIAEVHLNIDTGMHRVGMSPRQATSMAQAVAAASNLRLGGIWTHFAVADEPSRPETQQQLAHFNAVLDELGSSVTDDVIVHASNSAGLLAVPAARFNMVRVGISAYGIEPAAGLNGGIDLEPVLALRSELSFVKQVKAGQSISYGLAHTFERDTVVGTVPIGYADGLRRSSFAQGVPLLVGGERRPIVGVVTMDQTMVDLGPASTAAVGDPVVVIGVQGEDELGVNEIADELDTIGYEVLCAIGSRVPRRYVD